MPRVFESTNHPKDRPPGVVYGRFLSGPLGAWTVPLMIGATASALQGHSIWTFLVWGLPGALLGATLWTHFTLSRTIVEIVLRPGQAALRSVNDVLYDRDLVWQPLYYVRATPDYTELSIGWTTYELTPNRWPQYPDLQDAAQEAYRFDRSSSSRPASYA